MEFLRRRRILRKSIGKMIQNMSINFESGFWKWKFVLTRCGKQLNPRHSIFFKRISAIASSYQTRLEQFSLFKLVLNYKTHQLNHRVTLPKAIAQLIKDSESDRSDPRPIQSRDPNMPEENLFRLGALEILFLRLECAKLRRFSWVLSAIYSNFRHFDCFEQERKNFKEKIAEIRYERQSLLEDNNTLRLHNDNLISSLEKNTEDLQEISLTMDYLKINSMVKAIERVFDYNLLTSFYKLNQKVD
jgi:regulator of replication initiation timing